jgi:cytoskeletal protein CcmA (bactofilin family)
MSENPTQRASQARLVSAERFAAITSLIGEGAVFEGDFFTSRDLGIRIDGRVKGAIRIDIGGAVHIGPTAVVEGTSIEADHIYIEGRVSGQLLARKTLEITGSATVIGDAQYDGLLDIHPKARIRGQLIYRGDMDEASV